MLIKADGCYFRFGNIVGKERNLVLLQYPDGADCPLRVSSEMKKSEEWLHGGGCGCVCVGKRKSDHVTSLIHPLGLMYAAGQRNGHSGSVQLFGAVLHNHAVASPVITAL